MRRRPGKSVGDKACRGMINGAWLACEPIENEPWESAIAGVRWPVENVVLLQVCMQVQDQLKEDLAR